MVPLIFPTIICAGPYRNSTFLMYPTKIPENIRLVNQNFQFKKRTTVFQPVLRIRKTLMRIRILLFTLMRVRIRILPSTVMRMRIRNLPLTFSQICTLQMIKNDPLKLPPFHCDAEPDLAFHFDADADPIPDLAFHFDADAVPGEQKSCFLQHLKPFWFS